MFTDCISRRTLIRTTSTVFLALLLLAAGEARAQRTVTKEGNNVYYNSKRVGIGSSGGRLKPGMKAANTFTDFSDTINSTVSSGTIFNNSTTSTNGGFFHLGTSAMDAYWGAASSSGSNPFSSSQVANNALYFGNRDNVALQLLTAATVRMTISGSGAVGIGTTSPTTKLTITDGADPYNPSVTDLLQLKRNASNGAADNGASILFGNNSNAFRIKYGGTSDRLGFVDGGNIEGLSILNGGNVGIGTTSPTTKLTITDGATPYNPSVTDLLQLKRNASNGTADGGASMLFGNNSNAFRIKYGGTSDRLGFVDGGNIEALSILNGGNVGIGTPSPGSYKLNVNGDTNVSGNLNIAANGSSPGNIVAAGTIYARYQDVAEWVPSSEQLSAGTVVVLDSTKSNQVIASTVGYDTRVAGVISAQPGIALGEKGEGKVLVATTGRVKIKVDASKSPIHIGDLLVTSDVPGVAMKSQPVEVAGRKMHMPGTLIGKALEPLDKGKGEILALLSLQ